MELRLSPDHAAYPLAKKALRLVTTVLHKKGNEGCKHTFFATADGLPSDCSTRLNKLLRTSLMLGEGVTGTSLRRAVAVKVLSDPTLTEEQKRGARERRGWAHRRFAERMPYLPATGSGRAWHLRGAEEGGPGDVRALRGPFSPQLWPQPKGTRWRRWRSATTSPRARGCSSRGARCTQGCSPLLP